MQKRDLNTIKPKIRNAFEFFHKQGALLGLKSQTHNKVVDLPWLPGDCALLALQHHNSSLI